MGAVTWPELLGAISLACDIGMVMPLETGLGTAVVAVGLAERMEVDDATRQRAFEVSLLQHVGCTAPASEVAAIMGDEMLMREHIGTLDFTSNTEMARFMVGHVARANPLFRRPAALVRAFAGNKRFMATADGACEAGEVLGRCYGASEDTVNDLAFVYEAWGGHGIPAGVVGDAIPLAVQIVHGVARRDGGQCRGHRRGGATRGSAARAHAVAGVGGRLVVRPGRGARTASNR